MRAVWLLLCLFSYEAVFSQVISEIGFSGLRRTKVDYVSNFVESQIGAEVDSSLLEADRQRLANLEIFSDARFSLENLESGEVKIIFECKELFTLLPIFNFGGIEENFWFQIGGTEANLMGRGNKLSAYYQLYDRSSFATHWSFDWIKNTPWGLNVNLIKWGTLEPLFFEAGTVEYNYDNYTIGADGVYHLNYFDRILVGGAYFTEIYEAASEVVAGAPRSQTTNKILAKIILTRNKVNGFYFYQNGYSVDVIAETVQSLDGDLPFYIAFSDWKYFKRVGKKGNFASRLRFGLSTNHENPFAPFVLDSYLNIRGIGNRVDRGTGAIVLNAEYRHSCIDQDKLALQLISFIDAGTWRNPGGEIDQFAEIENQVYFGGVGARFIHKRIYNAILRVDYGFDLKGSGNNGFVLGLGQYF